MRPASPGITQGSTASLPRSAGARSSQGGAGRRGSPVTTRNRTVRPPRSRAQEVIWTKTVFHLQISIELLIGSSIASVAARYLECLDGTRGTLGCSRAQWRCRTLHGGYSLCQLVSRKRFPRTSDHSYNSLRNRFNYITSRTTNTGAGRAPPLTHHFSAPPLISA